MILISLRRIDQQQISLLMGCKLQGLEFNFLEGRCKYIPGKVNLFPTVY